MLFSADGFVGLVTQQWETNAFTAAETSPFTWLWCSAAQRVPSSLPGPRRRPRRRQPPSKSTLCKKAPPLHDFQLCARGKLQCQIPCELQTHLHLEPSVVHPRTWSGAALGPGMWPGGVPSQLTEQKRGDRKGVGHSAHCMDEERRIGGPSQAELNLRLPS